MQGTKRRRGGQPGNRNAWKHGRRSAVLKAERQAAFLKEFEEQCQRQRARLAAIPPTDYASIVDAIRASAAQSSRPTAPKPARPKG